ncbi:unnamed protein product, partial [Discosporangium mesarthrocarpum]
QELRRRFGSEEGVSSTAFAVNPGAVRSDIWRFVPAAVKPLYNLLMRLFFLDVKQGSHPSVCASSLPSESLAGSDYYQPYWLPFGLNHPFEVLGVYVGCAPAKPSVPRDEPVASREMWETCEALLRAAASRHEHATAGRG